MIDDDPMATGMYKCFRCGFLDHLLVATGCPKCGSVMDRIFVWRELREEVLMVFDEKIAC